MGKVIYLKNVRAERNIITERYQTIASACDDISNMLLSRHAQIELIKDVMSANFSDATKIREIEEILQIK